VSASPDVDSTAVDSGSSLVAPHGDVRVDDVGLAGSGVMIHSLQNILPVAQIKISLDL
jgi:hypothetical protein